MATEWKQASFKLTLTPKPCSKIEDVIQDAHRLAQELNVIVCFDCLLGHFNGCCMEVSSYHKKEWLLELWKNYLANMSQCKGELK